LWIDNQRSDGTKNTELVNKQLPMETTKETILEGQRTPIRQQQYDNLGAAQRFVVEDNNAATHLARNVMGYR
jgi:pyruvate dehydrogenase phosphatase